MAAWVELLTIELGGGGWAWVPPGDRQSRLALPPHPEPPLVWTANPASYARGWGRRRAAWRNSPSFGLDCPSQFCALTCCHATPAALKGGLRQWNRLTTPVARDCSDGLFNP